MLKFLIQQSPMRFMVVVIAGVCSGLSSATLIALINSSLMGTRDFRLLSQFFLLFLGVLFFSSYLARRTLLSILKDAVNRLRLTLCHAVLESPLLKLEKIGKSKITAALTEDVLLVSDTLALFPVLAINVAVVAACFMYLFWLSPLLCSGMIVLFAGGIYIHSLIASSTKKPLEEGRAMWDDLMGCYHDLIEGNKELKLNDRQKEKFYNEHLRNHALKMQDVSLRWHHIFAIAALFGQIFYFVVIGSIVFLAPQFGFENRELLGGFCFMALYLIGPISGVVDFIPSYKRANISLDRITQLGFSLNQAKESDFSLAPIKSEILKSVSKFLASGISFSYLNQDASAAPFVLELPDISFEPGEITFVVGHNGSGKSSLVKILSGLYAQENTCLKLYTKDMQNISSQEALYHQYFGVVFSDFHLFRHVHAFDTSQQERALQLLKPLGLHNKVDILTTSFSTIDLSQGQKKRLALLIALVQNKPIYIFDEWASDQDPEFKKYYYCTILPQLKSEGKIVIVISHDDRYFYIADKIIQLDKGRIKQNFTARQDNNNLEGERQCI